MTWKCGWCARAAGLMRAEQSARHRSSPAIGVPRSSTITPLALVRPDDHSTRSRASSTLNSMNARRNATPGGEFVAGLVGDGHLGAQHVAVAPDLADADIGGAALGLVEHGVFGRGQRIDAALGRQHRIFGADAEQLRKLLRHLDQEDVEPDQRVAGIALADRQIDVLRRQRVLGLREVAVLLDGRDLAPVGNAGRIAARHVALLARLRLGAGAERQRAVGGRAGAVGAERPFRIGRLLVGARDRLAAMQDRQVHGVAARANLRALHVLAVLRHHAGGVGHRLLLGIAERSVDLAGRTEQEIAGEGARQPGEARIGPLLPRIDAGILRLRLRGRGRLLAEHHAVAGGAGDAVARQRRVMRERSHFVIGLERNRIQVVALKRLARAGLGVAIGGELALALHGVAAEAGVLDRLLGFRMEGLDLARKLREENRIAAGEALSATCARCRRARGSPSCCPGPARSCRTGARCRRRCGSRCIASTSPSAMRAFGRPAGAQTWS